MDFDQEARRVVAELGLTGATGAYARSLIAATVRMAYEAGQRDGGVQFAEGSAYEMKGCSVRQAREGE